MYPQSPSNHPPARKKQHLSSPAPATAKQQPQSKSRDSMADLRAPPSNVVNIYLLLAGAVCLVRVAVVAVLVELETDALVALVAVCVGLVDLCVFGEFAVGF